MTLVEIGGYILFVIAKTAFFITIHTFCVVSLFVIYNIYNYYLYLLMSTKNSMN